MGSCCDCSGPLELFEIDLQRATKIMLCRDCGLFHYFRKDFLGNYKLMKATKMPDSDKGLPQPPDK